jgi:hypothetical protein
MTPTSVSPRVYGTWPGGMPFLSLGSGPPLVVLAGITPNHEPPRGADRRFQARQLMLFAASRRVWWVNRRPGLDPDATMADPSTCSASPPAAAWRCNWPPTIRPS